MARIRRVPLGPLMGANGTRITDRALQSTYMRGAYNVECQDGEWWTRKGEEKIAVRYGSTIWRWIFDIDRDSNMTVICNEYYALLWSRSSQEVGPLYDAAGSGSTTFTNASTSASISAYLPVVGQLMLGGSSGFTDDVYRVTAVSGVGPYTITLDRPYEGTTGATTFRYYDILARNVAGTGATHSNSGSFRGSAVIFEQLVTHSAGASEVHGASPAVTGGNRLLIITSNVGVPVAIDVDSSAAPKRLIFYNTALGTAAQIGSDTADDLLIPRGIWATVYRNRLWIGYASDPNGKYGARTIWYSQPGDCLLWHTGIKGQTAAPNFITFGGVGNSINELRPLQDSIIVHREDTQMIGNATGGSPAFQFRENNQGIGVRSRTPSNRVAVVNGLHYIWTQRGPAVFDGTRVSLIAREAYRELATRGFVGENSGIRMVQHDPIYGRLYWFGGTRSTAAEQLPAAATITYTSGDQVANYVTVFVYDYLNDVFWFEDRPSSYGGGLATLDNTTGIPRFLALSRMDGTIVAVNTRTKGKDASHLTPETSGDAVPVYAYVETPWLDFGTAERKQMRIIETIERGPVSGAVFEPITDISSGNWWLRCQVYRDYNRYADEADVGTVYASTSSQATTSGVDRQPPFFVRRFTPRSHGRQFKLAFSNALTASATTASYVQAPFRLHDIFVEIVDQQGDQPHTELSGASISE